MTPHSLQQMLCLLVLLLTLLFLLLALLWVDTRLESTATERQRDYDHTQRDLHADYLKAREE